jgi:hypothetical protein
MILVGYRKRTQRYGVLMWDCQRCNQPTPQALVGGRFYITLFLIPVIPIPLGKKLVCTQCGQRVSAPKAQLPAIEEAARAGAARAAAIQAAAARSVGGPMAPPFPAVASSAFPAYPAPAGGGYPPSLPPGSGAIAGATPALPPFAGTTPAPVQGGPAGFPPFPGPFGSSSDFPSFSGPGAAETTPYPGSAAGTESSLPLGWAEGDGSSTPGT